jgi:hypothetical protein
LLSGYVQDNSEVSGLHNQDFIHNGKKLINPLDSTVKTLQLGRDNCYLEHLRMVYNRFTYDQHGLKQEDIKFTDKQNWASAQRICQVKERKYLQQLKLAPDVHQEKTLANEMYLEICRDYIDIFLSVSLDLKSRIVLASKIFFFFCLWKLWFKNGDHGVLGYSKPLVLQEAFVSQQCFVDIQMSCHFVLLLIRFFRNKYSSLPMPLHLISSDACKISFSKIGGTMRRECAYDYH